MGDTSRSQTVSTKLQQIAQQAIDYPAMVFTTLMHLIDVDFLRAAYRQTRRAAAPGVDGVTASTYAEHLEANLQDLYERMRQGRYSAQPLKRVWLEKPDGRQRPIGIPAFEDKLVQRATAMLLGAIYEQDFYDFSYGFRPGRSAHQALSALRRQCMEMNIGWIIDADVCGFFDELDHGRLREIISNRVNDGALLRLIGKWLNAGVLDGQRLTHPDRGSPQGSSISPMLANIYLHQVLDAWYAQQIKPRLQGRSFLIRFGDDFVIGCEHEADARRVMAVLPKRLGRFGLRIHPQKTKLVSFGKPGRGRAKPDTFDFLGFTHYWGKSRRGYWIIKRKTARTRLRRTMKALWRWCRWNRHLRLSEQYRQLCLKLRGYYQYYGIRGNYKALEVVYEHAERAWRYWLSRRSRTGSIDWKRFERLRARYPLPVPRIVHAI